MQTTKTVEMCTRKPNPENVLHHEMGEMTMQRVLSGPSRTIRLVNPFVVRGHEKDRSVIFRAALEKSRDIFFRHLQLRPDGGLDYNRNETFRRKIEERFFGPARILQACFFSDCRGIQYFTDQPHLC